MKLVDEVRFSCKRGADYTMLRKKITEKLVEINGVYNAFKYWLTKMLKRRVFSEK